MSVWKKTMTWLGLDPDADYDEAMARPFNDPTLGPVDDAAHVGPTRSTRSAAYEPSPTEFSAVRSLGPMTDDGDPLAGSAASQPLSNTSLQPVEVPNRDRVPMGSVTAVPTVPPSRPQLVAPRSFNDAQEVADRFRNGAPVLLNLQETDSELGRRFIDFCSGLCYGLRGKMQRVGDRVFLVTPADVQLSPDDHQLIRDSGLLS